MELTRNNVDESVFLCGSDIKLEEVVKLVPSKPTPTGTLYLSNIDLGLVFPLATISFFHPPPSDKPGTEDVVDKAKEWLSQLLVPYHILAGRLQLNPGDGRLELNYNRSGVLFAGASSELTLVQLGDVSRPNPSFRNLIVRTDQFKELCNTPLMTMQVTRFKCGGFCVGLVISHVIMDGRSMAEFVLNLASTARGEGLLIEPNFDRTSLKARGVPPHINYQHNESVKLHDSMTASGPVADSRKKLPENKCRRAFTFSPEMLQRLKQKAMKDNMISSCSTFDVIAAHLWQARTRAIFQNPTQPSSVSFAVDIRSKVNPPLPLGFAGNGVVTAYATALVHDVMENPLSYCVAEIQKAVASITDDYVRSHIEMRGVNGGLTLGSNGNFYLSPWWKLSSFEFDIGLAKSLYAGPLVNDLADHFVLLLSNGSRQGIRVWITLRDSEMEKFEEHVKLGFGGITSSL